MRRVSVKYAKPGMVLGYPVYDNYGSMLLDAHVKLDEDSLKILVSNEVVEVLLDDWRVTDVPVEPLIPPELEGRAAQALRRLMIESQGKTSISDSNIAQVVKAVNAVANKLALASVGEVAITGIVSQEDYIYVQPMKTATLCLVMGQSLGYSTSDLASLGIATLLKDVGYIAIPQEILHKPALLTEKELLKIRQHPTFGYELLNMHRACSGEVANAVLQHHERWNGTGYPSGLKGAEISRFAQIIAIADSYTALISQRPGRKMYMPHETIEYIMAYSGEQFNRELVELFVRQVPCYSGGLSVELNTGETCIVSDANLGFIGRPTVRVCYDHEVGPVKKPYDIDLSKAEFQHKLIIKILDYY